MVIRLDLQDPRIAGSSRMAGSATCYEQAEPSNSLRQVVTVAGSLQFREYPYEGVGVVGCALADVTARVVAQS